MLNWKTECDAPKANYDFLYLKLYKVWLIPLLGSYYDIKTLFFKVNLTLKNMSRFSYGKHRGLNNTDFWKQCNIIINNVSKET